ncbi:MAG: hypothetical protein WC959_10290 [Kiritimatiellales bacterium]
MSLLNAANAKFRGVQVSSGRSCDEKKNPEFTRGYLFLLRRHQKNPRPEGENDELAAVQRLNNRHTGEIHRKK